MDAMKTALALGSLLVGALSQAAVVQVNGTTVGAPTFNRYTEDLTGPSAAGTAVPYSAYQFSVGANGFYAFNTAATFDSVSFLYAGAFNPAAPGSNVLIAQDDLLNGRTSGFGLNLNAGAYTLVTTGFSNSDAGKFSASIGGAGAITPVSGVPGPSPAPEILSIFGSTAGGPTFNRPLEDLSGLSSAGMAVPYSLLSFAVGVTGTYTFLLTSEFDSFLALYDGFSAGAPTSHLLFAKDDLNNGFTSGFEFSLQSGKQYQLVTTGFSNSDFGAYGLAVLGAGTVAAVPEPPVILLMLGGMLALCGRRLRAGSRRV